MDYDDYFRLANEMAKMSKKISFSNLDWIASGVMDYRSERDIMWEMYEKVCNAKVEITIDGYTFYF